MMKELLLQLQSGTVKIQVNHINQKTWKVCASNETFEATEGKWQKAAVVWGADCGDCALAPFDALFIYGKCFLLINV